MKQKKKLFFLIILFIIILFCFLFLFLFKKYNSFDKKKKIFTDKSAQYFGENNKIEEEKREKNLILVQKLAYLGLKEAEKKLNLFKNNKIDDTQFSYYEFILEGDPEKFKENVINGKLQTATIFLIQGTIDFLSRKLNKRINLIINNINYIHDSNHENSSNKNHQYDEFIDLRIRNDKNTHFFINEPFDTPGDGYCFFHAIKFVLNQNIPKWLDIIKEDLNFDLKKIN
jgi:hypothetical protein